MHVVHLTGFVLMCSVQAIQQNYQTILATSCSNLANTLAEPQYGTPSAE